MNVDRHAHAGHCINVDGYSWHQDGERCRCCGYGIDGDHGEPRGQKDVTPRGCPQASEEGA